MNTIRLVLNFEFRIDLQFKTRFPKLRVLTYNIEGIKVEKNSVELEKFKDEITKQINPVKLIQIHTENPELFSWDLQHDALRWTLRNKGVPNSSQVRFPKKIMGLSWGPSCIT